MNWIVCLKHGTKYGVEYVNRLYSMCKRNSNVPFNFACITENTKGMSPEIVHIPLPSYNLSGWWFKPWVLSKELPLDGNILFLDLDLVIIKNIDNLWIHEPEKFCIIRDFNRYLIPTWPRFNSSAFRFQSKKYSYVWDNLVNNLDQIKKFHGDQDWLYEQIKKDYSFWPDQWIKSYKWEIRNRSELIKDEHGRRFKTIADPKIERETSILVFHGEPNPHQVQDPIIVDNWR